MDAIVWKPVWTEARTQRIAELWSTSMTAQEIAADIGGFESYADGGRCAVIGKGNRMKLPARGVRVEDPAVILQRRLTRSEKNRISQNARRAAARGEAKPEEPAPEPVLPFIGVFGIPFADLQMLRGADKNQCRYIEPKDFGPEYLACGNQTKVGRSYCSHHHGIVYVKRSASANPSKLEGLRCL